MENINYRGVESIRKYIESSKRNYFAIYQVGKKAQPVWKQVTAPNSKKAAEAFVEWADIIMSGDPTHSIVYELRMYENTADESEDIDLESKPLGMRAGRSGLVITFCLNATANQTTVGQSVGNTNGYISPDLMQARLDCQQKEFDNQLLQLKQKSLEDRLSDIEAQLEEAESGEGMSGVDDIMDHPLVKMFAPLIASSIAGGAAPAIRPVISGLQHSDTLSEALAILADGNPGYADDLMRLAVIKRDNVGLYNMLINNLRTM